MSALFMNELACLRQASWAKPDVTQFHVQAGISFRGASSWHYGELLSARRAIQANTL